MVFASNLLWKIIPMAIGAMFVAVIFVLLRNKATPLRSLDDFNSRIASGKPTYLRFFKNT